MSELFPQHPIVPKNAVYITVMMTIKVGGMERSYQTSLMVQTHDKAEIRWAVDSAWKATRVKEAVDAAAAVPPEK